MKLLTFRPPRARTGHLGVLLGDRVLDINALPNRKLPATLMECIEEGDTALEAIRAAAADAQAALARGEQPATVFSLKDVTVEAPLIPGKIMAVGRNYADHAAEGGVEPPSRVAGFVKLTSSIAPHEATVHKPVWTETLDYENELAIVMGKHCTDVEAGAAYDYVFGYTIMNDFSARDVQFAERKTGNLIIGKNFPGAAPLGPWIVTKDEIPNPHNLQITTRVNGEVRQNANTSTQIHHIPAQIEWFSHAGFAPGDIISSGTPAGTAMGYKGPGSWYLKDGDRVECEIESIGTLSSTISTRKLRKRIKG